MSALLADEGLKKLPPAPAVEPTSSRQIVAETIRRSRAAWAPPPRLTVSEFADRELVVTIGPQAAAKWRTDFAPYQRGIMNAFHEPGVEQIAVKCSSQVGKTAVALNLVAYHIAHDPCPILVVQPTREDMAKDFSVNRLDPLIEASPILRDRVSKRRAKRSSNTVFSKTFLGGTISIAGANSAASLAARPIRFLVLDEIDRFPLQLAGEGNTISIAVARTKAFGRRRRIAAFSSPTIVGAAIDQWFEEGDQRYYYVPCPGCGEKFRYTWKCVVWKKRDASTARIRCPHCKYKVDEAERVALLADGEWIAENPDRDDKRIVSFHLSELYSPFSTLADVVDGFLKARKAQKAGDNSKMHTWQNTSLGEAVELDEGEQIQTEPLLLRREQYGDYDVPGGACLLTMGVDTQDDRLELLVQGWGPGEESWLIHRDILPGDPIGPEPWDMLDAVLDRHFLHESGATMMVTAAFVDSAGHRTDQVYDYCHKRAARWVFASIGRDGPLPILRSPSMPRKRVMGGRKCALYVVGVDAAKALLASRLKKAIPKEGESWDGFIHIPHRDWADEELIRQLTAERLVTKWHKGHPVSRWVQTRARNEMLDCAVLNIAALRRINPEWKALVAELDDRKPAPEKKASKKKKFLPKRSGWLDR